MNGKYFVWIFLSCCTSNVSFAEDNVQQVCHQLEKLASTFRDVPDGPLCGVYATYRALKVQGYECTLEQFMKRRFVSQCGGSTERDIKKMAEEVGGQATASGNLSVYDLQMIGEPFIANVRSCPSSERFDHWVAVIPSTSGFTLLDGIEEAREISVAEFSSLWRGSGVFVGRQAGVSWLILLGRVGLVVGVVPVGLVLRSIISRSRTPLSPSAFTSKRIQLLGILGASFATSCVGSFFFGDLKHYRTGLGLAVSHVRDDFEEIPIANLLNGPSGSDLILVDARRSSDFQLGTLPAAINLPVDASYWTLKDGLRSVPRTMGFIVFCQSESCDFDTAVARRLRSLGFEKVFVAKGGWREARSLLN